jgi:hypothetical protein
VQGLAAYELTIIVLPRRYRRSQRLIAVGIGSRWARAVSGGIGVMLGGIALLLLPYMPNAGFEIAMTIIGTALPTVIYVIGPSIVAEITPVAQCSALLAIGTAIGISAGLVAPMSAVTAGSPHNSTARGRSSTCQGRATRRSVLTFSVSVMIAAENGPLSASGLFLRFTATPAQVGLGVRIRLAPAASRVRTRSNQPYVADPPSPRFPPSRQNPSGALFSRFLDGRRVAFAPRKIEKIGWHLIEIGEDFRR